MLRFLALCLLVGCTPSVKELEVRECTDDRHCDYGQFCNEAALCEPLEAECQSDEQCPTGQCTLSENVLRCVAFPSATCGPTRGQNSRICDSFHDCPAGAACVGNFCRRQLGEAELEELRAEIFPFAERFEATANATFETFRTREQVLRWKVPSALDAEHATAFLLRELPVGGRERISNLDRVRIASHDDDTERTRIRIENMSNGGSQDLELPPGRYYWLVVAFRDLEPIATSNIVPTVALGPPSGGDACGGCVRDVQTADFVCAQECRARCASDQDCGEAGGCVAGIGGEPFWLCHDLDDVNCRGASE